jgi:bis(5'-nucleosyl)-tetraphosphatase (symmetrical)
MAVYAVGDVQGCYDALQRLLDKLKFDPVRDQLWLAGDLVNRGPDSLATLRFVRQLGDRAVTVLGNHDLHLLAIHADHKTTRDRGLCAVLDAHDADDLVDWLRCRPLLHYDPALDSILVHAGIYPGWTLVQAQQRALELQDILCSNRYLDFIHHMYGNQPDRWDDHLAGWDRLRFICNSFTRMRFCKANGRLDLKDNRPPGQQARGTLPWFAVEGRKIRNSRILFGHWSTLGLWQEANIFALDTGCVWGGKLTALRIDTPEPVLTSYACPTYKKPGK